VHAVFFCIIYFFEGRKLIHRTAFDALVFLDSASFTHNSEQYCQKARSKHTCKEKKKKKFNSRSLGFDYISVFAYSKPTVKSRNSPSSALTFIVVSQRTEKLHVGRTHTPATAQQYYNFQYN
jgi:hypothetical protein